MSDDNLAQIMSNYEDEFNDLKTLVRTSRNQSEQIFKMMTELQEQLRGLHSSVDEMKSRFFPTPPWEPPTPTREEVPQLYEEIPPIRQASGKPGKRAESFKSAVLRVVRERWSANEIPGGLPLTDKEIQSSYSTLYKITGKIVKGLPRSLYKDQVQTFKNLPEETKVALINKLTSEANKMGFYIGQCKRDWIAREFLSVQIRNRAQRRLRGPKAPATDPSPAW
jgi:hypothetical protein